MHYIIQSYNYMINILCRFCCCMWHGCSKIKQWSWHIKPFHCTISWTYQWQNRKLYSYHIIISISYHIISYHIISYHHINIISYYHHIILPSSFLTSVHSCALHFPMQRSSSVARTWSWRPQTIEGGGWKQTQPIHAVSWPTWYQTNSYHVQEIC